MNNNPNKPYTMEDLKVKMNERNYKEEELKDIRRQIRIEEGKLDTLKKDEVKMEKSLYNLDIEVLDMADKIRRGA